MPAHRVALIGFFSSVAGARASLPPGCELVGLCDIRQDLLERCRKEDPSLFITDDFRKIAAMPNCDSVVAWTPNTTHRDIAVASLRGGKHVFIEKPMGINLAQGKEIVEAERASGKYCAVDLEYRVSRFGRAVKEILDSGELGEIRQVDLEHHRGGWLCDTPSGTYRTKKEFSGLMKMEGIHYIDLFRFWLGPIRKVQAFSAPNTLPHYEFPDNVTAMIWFANGALGRYTTSHNKAGYAAGADMQKGPTQNHVLRWILTGTKGVLLADGWTQRIDVLLYDARPAGTNSLKAEFERRIDFSGLANPHDAFHDIAGCRREFMRRMAAGLPPVQRAEDAYRSECIAVAVDEAMSVEGGVVECAEG